MDDVVRKRLEEAAKQVKTRAEEIAHPGPGGVPDPNLQIEFDQFGARIITYNNAARAYELGIRHPLNYPNQRRNLNLLGTTGREWGDTPHRPFLSRAAEETQDIVTETLAKVVEDYARGADYVVE